MSGGKYTCGGDAVSIRLCLEGKSSALLADGVGNTGQGEKKKN